MNGIFQAVNLTKGITLQSHSRNGMDTGSKLTLYLAVFMHGLNQKVIALEDRRKLRKFIVSGPPFVATNP